MQRNSKVFIVLLVITNIGWLLAYAYKVIDHGITMTYPDASFDSTLKMLDQAVVVANNNLVGTSLEHAQKVVAKDTYGLSPFIKEGCLYAAGVTVYPLSILSLIRVLTSTCQLMLAATIKV